MNTLVRKLRKTFPVRGILETESKVRRRRNEVSNSSNEEGNDDVHLTKSRSAKERKTVPIVSIEECVSWCFGIPYRLDQ